MTIGNQLLNFKIFQIFKFLRFISVCPCVAAHLTWEINILQYTWKKNPKIFGENPYVNQEAAPLRTTKYNMEINLADCTTERVLYSNYSDTFAAYYKKAIPFVLSVALSSSFLYSPDNVKRKKQDRKY